MLKCTARMMGAIIIARSVAFPQEPPKRLVLLAKFLTPLPSETPVLEMQRELESILAPGGLRPEWFIVPDLPDACQDCRLTHVKFFGHCATDGAVPAGARPPVLSPGWLGRTFISRGHILPFIEVDCDGVAALIWRGIGFSQRTGFDLLLGRALARVLAHELYHALAKTKIHGTSVLTRPSLGAPELLDKHTAFDPREIGRMFSSHSGDLREVARGRAKLAKP